MKPICRLGAPSPGRLALPSAQISQTNLYAPRGVWLDGSRLLVCDTGHHRVLIWEHLPDEDGTPADHVLGQPDFDSEGPAAGGRGPTNGLHLPTGILVVDGRLVIADAWHHRILVWNEVPQMSNVPPDYAIGQPDLTCVEPNHGNESPSPLSLYWPYGIGWIGGRFCVADTGNRRVLIWNGFPDPQEPPDVIVGQPDAVSRAENRGGSVRGDSFRWPHDFAGDERCWFVADAGNHRVLGWLGVPQEDRPADFVLGQPDMVSSQEFPYHEQGPARLRFPYAIAKQRDHLAVADTANNRILFWRLPLEQPSGAAAEAVIGQDDFAGNGENRWREVAPDSLCWPYGIAWQDELLAVADSGNNRVILWDVSDLGTGETSHVLSRAGQS